MPLNQGLSISKDVTLSVICLTRMIPVKILKFRPSDNLLSSPSKLNKIAFLQSNASKNAEGIANSVDPDLALIWVFTVDLVQTAPL